MTANEVDGNGISRWRVLAPLQRRRQQLQTGTMNRSAPFELSSVAIFGSQVQTIGNLFNGNEASGRIDFNPSASNRLFVEFNWLKTS